MRVAGIVVTYNRKELLRQTLAGLFEQERPLDGLIIIDNASDDGTYEELLARKFPIPTTLRRAKKNTGGAGGFAMGMQLAYEQGFDAFWLMDDDTVPHAGALGPLVEALAGGEQVLGVEPSFACSVVRWQDGSLCEMNTPATTWDWPRAYLQGRPWVGVESCSFVSVLISRRAVYRSGLPAANFFIWYDDAEYTTRISKQGPGICVLTSEVTHLLAQNRGVNFGDITPANAWKFTYGVRNQMASSISLRRPQIALDLVLRLITQAIWPSVKGHTSKRLTGALLVAAAKGLVFRPQIKFPPSLS